MFEILIAGTFGYLTGSIFISYYWGRLNGIDLTQEGTGQLGASNAGRTFGWPAMVIVGMSDILKATIALAILSFAFHDLFGSPFYDGILIVGSLGIVFGHVNSFWIWLEKHDWHGGKGGSSLGGILLFLSLESFVILFIVLMLTLKILKRYLLNGNWYENFSTNAIVALFSPFVILWFTGNITYFVLVLLVIGTILFFEREKISSILWNIVPKEPKEVWDQ
ncbi:MAG: glycerol-3-phosphate acyltransferase [Candidatus Heimdallarchaeota archaeon]